MTAASHGTINLAHLPFQPPTGSAFNSRLKKIKKKKEKKHSTGTATRQLPLGCDETREGTAAACRPRLSHAERGSVTPSDLRFQAGHIDEETRPKELNQSKKNLRPRPGIEVN